MKKNVSFFALSFVLCFSLSAQDMNHAILQTQHYLIVIEPGAENAAESLARELELRFAVYNTLFRFDTSALTEPFKARVFVDEDAYLSYIADKTGIKKDGGANRRFALYLHYNRMENRELVVCRGSVESSGSASDKSAALPHQAFVQFLRGFIVNPPSWMLEGFAVYFSTLTFDPGMGNLSYDENLTWLEEAKKNERSAESLKNLFEYDMEPSSVSASQDFQARSWALVSFFLISGLEEYYRTLTECFMLLSPNGTAAANSQTVIKHIGDWDNFDLMEEHFHLYLDARKTFNELIEEGRGAYLSGNTDHARLNFFAALEQKGDHYAPYYFLGLIYYEEKEHEIADELYRSSLAYGADEALISYSLGLNAAAAGNNDEAISWLRRASAADRVRYGQRSEDLIRRLQD